MGGFNGFPNLKINNVSVVIDYNNQQSFGKVSDTMDLEPLVDKLLAFGWNVSVADGHNIDELVNTLDKNINLDKPHIVVAHTIKGKGVSFMEGVPAWHGSVKLSTEELKKSLLELGASSEEASSYLDGSIWSSL